MLSLNLLGRYQQLSLHQGHQAATPAQVFLSEERDLFLRFCLVMREFFVIFHLTAKTLLARCCIDFLNLICLFAQIGSLSGDGASKNLVVAQPNARLVFTVQARGQCWTICLTKMNLNSIHVSDCSITHDSGTL